MNCLSSSILVCMLPKLSLLYSFKVILLFLRRVERVKPLGQASCMMRPISG